MFCLKQEKGIVAGDSFTPLVDLKDILYTISYVTTANLRMRTSKTTKLKHNVVLTNNQQNSFVDLNCWEGKQEKQNINRLGNDRLTAIGNVFKNSMHYLRYLMFMAKLYFNIN